MRLNRGGRLDKGGRSGLEEDSRRRLDDEFDGRSVGVGEEDERNAAIGLRRDVEEKIEFEGNASRCGELYFVGVGAGGSADGGGFFARKWDRFVDAVGLVCGRPGPGVIFVEKAVVGGLGFFFFAGTLSRGHDEEDDAVDAHPRDGSAAQLPRFADGVGVDESAT